MAKGKQAGGKSGKGKTIGSGAGAVATVPPAVRKVVDEGEKVVVTASLTGRSEKAIEKVLKSKPKHAEGFVLMNQAGLPSWATAHIFGSRTAVLFQLISWCDFANVVRFKRAKLARALGMDRSNLARTLGFLYQHDYLIRVTQDDQKTGAEVAMISPYVVWKGDPRGLERALGYERSIRRVPLSHGIPEPLIPPVKMELDQEETVPMEDL